MNVLLFDDDPMILRGLERLLRAHGVVVFGTTSPKAGLEVLRRNPERFDLVITDFHMPELTGGELIAQIRESLGDRAPTCICMSGAVGAVQVPDGVEVLQKPVGIEELLRAVKGGD